MTPSQINPTPRPDGHPFTDGLKAGPVQESAPQSLGSPGSGLCDGDGYLITVDLGERSYPIEVGAGLLERAGPVIQSTTGAKRVFILTDDTVKPLHLDRLTTSLDQAGLRWDAFSVAPGEDAKTFTCLATVIDHMLAVKAERSTVLVALGGGVVGDLAGFAAAIFMRGIHFVQIPTTLLAQVDSSVGGKTGINTARGKNLVGAFHQPDLVLADSTTLQTLPDRELKAGYAEVLKYALIDDADFFDFLDANGPSLLAGPGLARDRAVAHCCRAKARIVAEDERESGRRALLNLGHTFGHAMEAEVGFSDRLLHGEAVALGMVAAFDLSVRLGLCPADDLARLRAHMTKTGLPQDLRTACPGISWRADRLMAHMAGDKKVKDGRITFVLTRGIGKAFLTDTVDLEAVAQGLTDLLASGA